MGDFSIDHKPTHEIYKKKVVAQVKWWWLFFLLANIFLFDRDERVMQGVVTGIRIITKVTSNEEDMPIKQK